MTFEDGAPEKTFRRRESTSDIMIDLYASVGNGRFC